MYLYNIQLRPYNSFQTEAVAKVFCEPSNVEELRQCLLDFADDDKLIIGGGCNLFFTKDFDGIVIKPNFYGKKILANPINDPDHVHIEVMASEDWDELVEFCVNEGYSGLENLSYIPGTVGASPIQNIGAYGAEVKDCIYKVTTLNRETLEIEEFLNEECQFEYRDSYFKRSNKYIVISVEFCLNKTYHYTPKYADLNKELESIADPTIKDVREAVIRVRKRKLPDQRELPNAGSFFKNPYLSKKVAEKLKEEYPEVPLYPVDENVLKTSAAYLIDKAGYKGKQIGNIGTYPKQALIIVNYGSTNGNDIVSFMEEIQSVVAEKFNIQLEPEVRII